MDKEKKPFQGGPGLFDYAIIAVLLIGVVVVVVILFLWNPQQPIFTNIDTGL
jgi:hypothetical protein